MARLTGAAIVTAAVLLGPAQGLASDAATVTDTFRTTTTNMTPAEP